MLKDFVRRLLKKYPAKNSLRVWVPGCSTGEEAYSIAIIIKECLDELKQSGSAKIQLYATDIDKNAIIKARQGKYGSGIASDISPERLKRFFVRDNSNYMVKKCIREMVIFAEHSVIMDPPFIKIDILCCRNLLIYFNMDLQKKLLPLFHYALNPGGILFLGSSESIGGYTGLFEPLDNKRKIFRRTGSFPERALSPVFYPISPSKGGTSKMRTAEKTGIMPEPVNLGLA